MSEMSSLLRQLECLECISRQDIRTVKIDKLLRAIERQVGIPREDGFQFKERATSLLQKWDSILKARVHRVSASAAQC